jgi:hypothetical protein
VLLKCERVGFQARGMGCVGGCPEPGHRVPGRSPRGGVEPGPARRGLEFVGIGAGSRRDLETPHAPGWQIWAREPGGGSEL